MFFDMMAAEIRQRKPAPASHSSSSTLLPPSASTSQPDLDADTGKLKYNKTVLPPLDWFDDMMVIEFVAILFLIHCSI
jgi:hypothetical protein